MQSTIQVDVTGRHRSPATRAEFHRGRRPRNKGLRYPADPPSVEEIIAVMRAAGDGADGIRLRSLIVVLLARRPSDQRALALTETDLNPVRGAIMVRHGKGGKRREVGMDRWAWEQLAPWLTVRSSLPVGALFCILRGPTRGRPWAPAGVRMHASSRRRSRQGTPAVRAAPAPPCSCCRDVARGRPVAGHPTPARARRPRDHLGLPARDRQHRDHPRRPRAARADDPRAQRPQPIDLRHQVLGRPPTTQHLAGQALPSSRQAMPVSPTRSLARRCRDEQSGR